MERGAENIQHAPPPQIDREMVDADQTDMDPKVWNKLADDLLEKIIIRLPLKDIVQSQVLSKTWQSRFQSSSFQKEVSTFSSRWRPSAFYHPLCVTAKGLSGYDQSAQKWKDLCSLPDCFPAGFNELDGYQTNASLTDNEIYGSDTSDIDDSDTDGSPVRSRRRGSDPDGSVARNRWRLWGNGCFVVGSLVFSGHLSEDGILHIFVTNIINKTIRRCPPFPTEVDDKIFWENDFLEVFDLKVHPVGHDHYKLIVISYIERDPDVITATVFDSKLNSWKEFQACLPINWSRCGAVVHGCGNIVYIRGVVYVPYRTCDEEGVSLGVLGLCTFDVENELFGEIHPCQPVSAPDGIFLAWRSELLLVSGPYQKPINAFLPNSGSDRKQVNADEVTIYKVNLETLEHTEMLKGPPDTFHGWIYSQTVVSDWDGIHLILKPYAADIVHPVTGNLTDYNFCLDSEGSRIKWKTLYEKQWLATCELSKGLWSYSFAHSGESGYGKEGRIDLGTRSTFQPHFSPFLLA